MEENVNAIVMRVVKYNDKIQIADVLTKEHGRMSFAIPAGSNKKGGSRTRVLWRPLNILEFECTNGRHKGLQRPKDVRPLFNYLDVPYNPLKTMLALFVDELLCGSVWGEVQDEALYNYVVNSLKVLDRIDGGFANFHIAFSVGLLGPLGIRPNVERVPEESFFDLRAAEYTGSAPLHPDYLEGEDASAVEIIMRMNYSNMKRFLMGRTQRQKILDVVNRYYLIHVPGFKSMKSMEIFKDALS